MAKALTRSLTNDDDEFVSSSSLLGTTDAEKLAIDDWLAAVNTTYSGTEFEADCEHALDLSQRALEDEIARRRERPSDFSRHRFVRHGERESETNDVLWAVETEEEFSEMV